MASREQIRAWVNEAKKKHCTHLLVVCDTFDHEDYPVYIFPRDKAPKGEKSSVWKAVEYYHGPNMQTVMEVYDLRADVEIQLAMHRAGREFLASPIWEQLLLEFDPKYFDYVKEENMSLDDAAYHLATWMFDNEDQGKVAKIVKSFFPEKLASLACEKFIDGEHDT